MKRRKAVPYIVLAASLTLTMFLGIQYKKRIELQQGIAEKVLRFHVLANSDTAEDQRLKLKVRDAVGARMSEYLKTAESREESEAVVLEKMDEIKKTANRILAEEGFDYKVETCLKEVDFPVKTYGCYTFPAGRYEALEVVIGEGKGHNWWCVMYPNMCFSGSVYEVVEAGAKEELRAVLTEEEYEQIFTEGAYEIRFKCLEFLAQD